MTGISVQTEDFTGSCRSREEETIRVPYMSGNSVAILGAKQENGTGHHPIQQDQEKPFQPDEFAVLHYLTEENGSQSQHCQFHHTKDQYRKCTAQECRIPSNRFGDPKAQELFEMVAQELGRMVTMLEGYRTGNEPIGSSEQPAQPWGPPGTQPPRGPDIPIGVDDQVETPPRITSKEADQF
jgi:hypothetical protein